MTVRVIHLVRRPSGLLSPVQEVTDLPSDVLDIEGHIDLRVNGVGLLDFSSWDDLNLFWLLFTQNLEQCQQSGECLQYLSDSTRLWLRLRPQGRLHLRVDEIGPASPREAEVGAATFYSAMKEAGLEFVQWLETVDPAYPDLNELKRVIPLISTDPPPPRSPHLFPPRGTIVSATDIKISSSVYNLRQNFDELWSRSASSSTRQGAINIMVAGQEFFGVEQWGQLEVLWWKLAELINAVASDGAAETYFDDSSIHFAMQRTDADNVQLGWHSDVFHNGSSVNVQLRPLRAEFVRAGLEFCAWMESGEATDLSRDLRTRLESWTT